MGGMLVNVFVRSGDQAAVVGAAKAVLGPRYDADPLRKLTQGLRDQMPDDVEAALGDIFTQMGLGAAAVGDAPLFLVSPGMGGWVGVHDSGMQNQDESLCAEVAIELSARLQTTVISFLVHDGDFLCYWLARDGALLDDYNSMPDYFEEGPMDAAPDGGDAGVLAEACGVPDRRAEVADLLRDPDADAFGQLKRLGTALGIPDPDVDYDLLTYKPPKRIGFTVSVYEPQIARRGEYVAVTRADLNQ